MIYFALRSSEHYLQKLSSVRRTAEPYHLVSVAGGLAFLHGIGPSTRTLSVVDVDEEVVEYCRMIVGLIIASTSLDDFIQLITRHRFEWREGALVLTDEISVDPRARSIFSDRKLLNCFRRTVGAASIDTERCLATLGQSTILFQGASLVPFTFSWRFGEGNFSCEENFSTMQKLLRSTELSIEQGRLELFNFSALSPASAVIFLASNCESPLFTRGDIVFRSVSAGCTVPTRYVSWYRDIELHPHSPRSGWIGSPFPTGAEIPALPDRGVYLLAPPTLRSRHEYVTPDNRFETIEQLHDSGVFGGNLLIVELSALENAAGGSGEQLLESIYLSATPCFLELLLLAEESAATMLERTAATRFPLSYEVVECGSAGKGSYILMRLLGLSVVPARKRGDGGGQEALS